MLNSNRSNWKPLEISKVMKKTNTVLKYLRYLILSTILLLTVHKISNIYIQTSCHVSS